MNKSASNIGLVKFVLASATDLTAKIKETYKRELLA